MNSVDPAVVLAESSECDFKLCLPTSSDEWIEVIKDIVAMANSGGGILIFGVNNDGSPSTVPVNITSVDLADVGNKIYKYTDRRNVPLELTTCLRAQKTMVCLNVGPVPSPLVFACPGLMPSKVGSRKRYSHKEPFTSAMVRKANLETAMTLVRLSNAA